LASEQLKKVIEILRTRPVHTELDIDERRSEMEVAFTRFKIAADVRCDPVDAGGVPAEWVTAPGALKKRVIYYLHGGGYAMGSIKTHREMVSRLSRAACARVLFIDYRLAPESPFPAAVQDATAAYRWLLSTGVNPDNVVIAGESAGGGLAVSTLIALRDMGDPLPSAAISLSPWVDMEAFGESMTTKAEVDPLVSRESILMYAKAYLGNTDPRTPLAAPLYADLSGLPPLLVQVGTAEVLLDDATRLVEMAKSAGVDVILERYEGMIHMWHFYPMLPEGQQAIQRIAEFVGKHVG
jgi:monoterpene epsilon-lactone hydrolase